MWVARDKYRGLHLFNQKPIRNWSTLRWKHEDGITEPLVMTDNSFLSFPDLTWDDEPIEVDIHPRFYFKDLETKIMALEHDLALAEGRCC